MTVPDLLTIEEAARVLRIGRSTAYELANRDLATGGGEGLGVVRVGRLLRVRRTALEELVGGPLTVLPDRARYRLGQPAPTVAAGERLQR